MCKKYFFILIILIFTSFNLSPANIRAENNNLKENWKTNTVFFYDNLIGDFEKPKFNIFSLGLSGYYRLKAEKKLSNKNYLTIIDFTLPSDKKRLWIIDVENMHIMNHNLVAHGKNSGELLVSSFANIPNSFKSSLGFYVTGNTYFGKHDLSLRLNGMEPGINDKAEERAIVMHGAEYVSEEYILKNGRLGRSFGCPAISNDIAPQIINLLAGGTCLFIYGQETEYVKNSSFVKSHELLERY